VFQPGQVKPKTIKCVFVPSPLITQHYQGVRAKTGRLGVRIKMSEWSSLSTRRLLIQRVSTTKIKLEHVDLVQSRNHHHLIKIHV
jgi:hypothetical protein